jgi:hypothetical protein
MITMILWFLNIRYLGTLFGMWFQHAREGDLCPNTLKIEKVR